MGGSEGVDRRAILRTDIVALAHSLRGIMRFPEHLQQLVVADLGGIEHHEHDFGVARAAAAHLFVRGVGRVATGVADSGRVDARQLPELALGPPEASEPEDGLLEPLGEGRLEWIEVDEVLRRQRKQPVVVPGERLVLADHLHLVLAREHARKATGVPRSVGLGARA